MSTTFVVAVVNIRLRQHVMTTFCDNPEDTRQRIAELEGAYPGDNYRLMVSPSLAEVEDAEARAKDAIFREAWLQSQLMPGNRRA